MNHQHLSLDRFSPPEAKIALFRSLFRGRDDMYARRFENLRTGKSGYALVCGNEWVRGVCDKPRTKCAACPHQRFLPVTDEAVRWHLSGRDDAGREFVMGVYPLLRDETTFFLAIDLDKKDWRDDARAVMDTCRRLDLPAVLERSRGGNGCHLWLFFNEAIPAALARKLGAHLLTVTMDRRPGIGLDSYDRFFPNQDTLPQGGFGNLIALPLQQAPRERGNSVFLDGDLEPRADQWALLSAVQRIGRTIAEAIVSRAERTGRIIGVRLASMDDDCPRAAPRSGRRKEPSRHGPLPNELELILANQIYMAKHQLTPGLESGLVRAAAFENPEFHKAQAMRLPTFGKPRVIACAEDHPRHLGLPRGCLDEVQALLADLRIGVVVRDERYPGRALEVEFQGQLNSDQEAAAKAMLARDTGVLSATTAFGKTVVAAWLIAERGASTLVVVHRRQLMEQWVERLATFLNLPSKEIGQIGGGRRKPTGSLDVALIQSLSRKGVVLDLVGDPGKQEPLIDRSTWDRVQEILGSHFYRSHELTYGGELIRCGFCGHPITGERKFKMTKSGERAYTYYRCAKYTRPGHPRTRVREEDLDQQILALFDRIRIQDDAVRDWFRAVLASQTRDQQHETRSQREELQRQLTMAMNQQDRVVNLRVDGEIDADVFAKKQTELRDRMASLKLQMDALDRNRDEMADLVSKVFELSQTLREKWLTADYSCKRRILEIICLNFSLDDTTLCHEMRKPFDVLAEGLPIQWSRGDCPSFEPWIAALVEAALSPSDESVTATRVLRLSA